MVLASPALACATPTLLSNHHHHHVNRCSSCCLPWRYVYVFVSAQLTHFRNLDIIFFCLAEIYCCTIIRYRGSLPLQGSRMTHALQGTASLLALSKGFAFAVIHHLRRTHQSSYDCVRYLYLPPKLNPQSDVRILIPRTKCPWRLLCCHHPHIFFFKSTSTFGCCTPFHIIFSAAKRDPTTFAGLGNAATSDGNYWRCVEAILGDSLHLP